MPIANAPRSRSPYTVHQGGRFVCQAPDLYALSAVLEELDTRFQAIRQQEEARRAQGLRFGGLWRDLPEKPPIQVVDNRGEVRPELSSAWRIRHYFNRKAKGTPVLEDFPWDGDTRPRGMPVEGTGQRPRYSRAYLRRPKTQHDRRLGFPLFEDGEPEFRGARRPRDLPTLWDDMPRRSRKDRSWKNFRATQWRQKG
jgi:hypothetical protein